MTNTPTNPDPTPEQVARAKRPDAVRILREVEYAIGEEFPTATRAELIDRIAAALATSTAKAKAEGRVAGLREAVNVAKDELWSNAICEQYPHRAEQNNVTKCVIDALEQAVNQEGKG